MISRGIPHLGLKDPVVIGKVLASEQPERSSMVTTDEIWDIVVRYWDTNPVNQPSAGGHFKALTTDTPVPPISPRDDPAKLRLGPEFSDDSFISIPSLSPKPLPPETSIVQRFSSFDLHIPRERRPIDTIPRLQHHLLIPRQAWDTSLVMLR